MLVYRPDDDCHTLKNSQLMSRAFRGVWWPVLSGKRKHLTLRYTGDVPGTRRPDIGRSMMQMGCIAHHSLE